MEYAKETTQRLRKRLIKLTDMLRVERHYANHDMLTGLPNRRLLHDRLEQAMAVSARQQRQLAILMIDLDDFKQINDHYGHEMGDLLLKQVADRLNGCLRVSDTASRIGGDEFVVMLPEINSPNSVHVVIEKIRQSLAAPYMVKAELLEIGASIGVTVYYGENQTPEQLIAAADHDMYRVKTMRRNAGATSAAN